VQLFTNRGVILGRIAEARNPGDRQPFFRKLVKGALLVGLLIIVIWSPLLIMSIANDNSVSNIPIKVEGSLMVGSFQPVFEMDVLPVGPVSAEQYQTLLQLDSTGFVKQFQREDIQRAVLSAQSKSVWSISPTSRQVLVDGLSANRTMTLTFSVTFDRRVKSGSATTSLENEKHVLAYNSSMREQLLATMEEPGAHVSLEDLFPVFYHLTSLDKPEPHQQLPYTLRNYLRNCSLHRQTANATEWWSLEQTSAHIVRLKAIALLGCAPVNRVVHICTSLNIRAMDIIPYPLRLTATLTRICRRGARLHACIS